MLSGSGVNGGQFDVGNEQPTCPCGMVRAADMIAFHRNLKGGKGEKSLQGNMKLGFRG